MNRIIAAAIAVAALAACHKAADTTNATTADAASAAAATDMSNRANPPIASEQNRQTPAPAAGSNSFTQGQAMDHLAHAGYANVSGMTQDDKGVWHGQATNKDGKAVAVSVDYQGSVSEQ